MTRVGCDFAVDISTPVWTVGSVNFHFQLSLLHLVHLEDPIPAHDLKRNRGRWLDAFTRWKRYL
jgi:hypothetical protein